jgi:hypothetical protein
LLSLRGADDKIVGGTGALGSREFQISSVASGGARFAGVLGKSLPVIRDPLKPEFPNSAGDPFVLTGMFNPKRTLSSTIYARAALALAFLLATALQAQTSITGKWQGTTRNGMQVVLNLKAAGAALTGTVTRDGQTSTITEGKVTGAEFAFKANLGEQIEALSGERDGNQLKVWLDRQGPEGSVVFDRVKE